MKSVTLIASIIFATASHLSFGQGDASVKKDFKRVPMYSALFILKSDYRTMEIDPKKNEIFDVKAIDKRFVRFVTVLNSEQAKKLYGERGANGVVIVQFEDHYVLSRENLIKSKNPD
ncbi:MAG: hypothetical protein WA874_08060 [Chryseosolibacter sp.]